MAQEQQQQQQQVVIRDAVKTCPFALTKAPQSLRVCCFGSSSSETPQAYLQPSAEVGYLLAVRGHVCVNGAGSFGCMAAMNHGAVQGNGDIVGIIHEMWLQNGEDVKQNNAWGLTRKLRDRGAHAAFDTAAAAAGSSRNDDDKDDNRPIRELLVAGGKDLQERKRLLLENADALVVLPGGPGTFDELWEMACSRNIGLSRIPIVCVNIDGFYDPFRVMLERAWADKLTKLAPDEIIHLADSAEEAIAWIEQVHQSGSGGMRLDKNQSTMSSKQSKKNEKNMLRFSSIMGNPSSTSIGKTTSSGFPSSADVARFISVAGVFALGVAVGTVIARKTK